MLEISCYDLPSKAGDQRHIGQLTGAAYAIECAEIIERHHGLVMLITQDIQHAQRLYEEIKQFTDQRVIQLPSWETLPFDRFSPDKAIISARLSILCQLPILRSGILILPVSTLMQRVCPSDFLQNSKHRIKIGQKISQDQACTQLKNSGYRGVHHITEHGDFSHRGAFLYVYPMGSDQPYRISFSNNAINSLHSFSLHSQDVETEVTEINLLPANEFPTDPDTLTLFLKQWNQNFGIQCESSYLYQQVRSGILPIGIEYWQPLFFKRPLSGIFRYLPSNTLIVTIDDLQKSAIRFWNDINVRYDKNHADVLRPLLSPTLLWLSSDELLHELHNWPSIKLSTARLVENSVNTNLEYAPIPDFMMYSNAKKPLDGLCQFLDVFKGQVVFSVKSEGRREVLQERLAHLPLQLNIIHSLAQARDNTNYLLISASEVGFIDMRRNRALICESNLLGENFVGYDRGPVYKVNPHIFINHFSELHPGQLVVHIEHGIGRYMGLVTLETNGILVEYLMLVYAGDTKLYVPISSLHLISRYMGVSNSEVPLHKLGRDAWSRSKHKAMQKIRDVAVELLDIYAQRTAKPGFAFKHDPIQYQLFCEHFPFITTIDQEQAINAVLSDMCQAISMDRVVCGDVGFGKTEVAMRAAFLAVMNHKQVAVLVPTTLLAQQHYDNFRDRFANWPICIKMLSRFCTEKEQSQVLEYALRGKVDILIGTHKLLQNKMKWYDLGLLIVDEEHRFGVRHKERIKAMRTDVDILTLTATPIPRTLNMAMHGIRDLSIIATPPARRLPVKTFVYQYDERIVCEAILREVLRGGQVYYLYNDVDNIAKVTKRLSELIPEARIALGHGQMHERELEQVMHDFYHQRFNVLVCTTIIETGIDIPSANTIIIERADRFGLAQLHQLRGRVGRSHHQAYAWLLTPHPKAMTINAHKRLEAITAIEDLGAGLALATHDLEIRGAGELLGEGQSGQIENIGFSLYTELLDHTVDALKVGHEPSLVDLTSHQTDIELRIPSLLPSDFIPDVNTRLSFYKRIASAQNGSVLENIKRELIDHFGLLPDAARTFLDISKLRIIAKKIGIKKIEVSARGGFIELYEKNTVDFELFLDLFKKEPKSWILDGPTRIRFISNLSSDTIRMKWVTEFIYKIAHHNALI
ncbi:transcription-repair coupling factor [Candidatus Erwinia haradaeae]|uniref:Transcription-repair-coupling factor n=1 Tax=Candidatus Erwinia haradaeae TaxID=1922217 RepID=A0A451D9P3_9GAMM|nr:transcription-repair coupling factor [Candidatus Erwinia haradaeae]VFP82969.1 Transcription-repair-coupling factor [Candidatus Erwinia haradaeae]